MKTATHKMQWVEVLHTEPQEGLAYVMDEDGGEYVCSLNELENIEEEVTDYSPLEQY
tara:strand:+ start:527 stop:697 length:171 start_codon:yes stop_codon:yes gene_type:complete